MMPRAVWYVQNEEPEVVRIQAMKCDGLMQPECKKLCVDPRLTSFQVLQKLLAKAFNINEAFSVSYQASAKDGKAIYLAMVSDWDVDAAFLSSSDPVLRLKVEVKLFEQGELLHEKLGLEEWDIIGSNDVSKRTDEATRFPQSRLDSFTESISNQVTRTVSQVSRVMGLKPAPIDVDRPVAMYAPMSDTKFHSFLDPVGHLSHPEQFRLCVYHGGIEPSLRKVVWRHLLNIYPEGLNGRVRFEYLRMKSSEYVSLRDEWRESYMRGDATDEVRDITVMVKKDVRRTDRTHAYYAGADDNPNLKSLFDLLVTYALTHPDVSYCQGMSDIASTLLVIQNNEAHAYVCFCGLMRRLKTNFLPDGEAITTQFAHLTLLLQHHEPEFFEYLCQTHAHGLLFCYRWLLLELKREFPFDDSLHMLDVLWSSLPPDYPDGQLQLVDLAYHNHNINRAVPGSHAACSQNSHVQNGECIQVISNGVEITQETTATSHGESANEHHSKDDKENDSNVAEENDECVVDWSAAPVDAKHWKVAEANDECVVDWFPVPVDAKYSKNLGHHAMETSPLTAGETTDDDTNLNGLSCSNGDVTDKCMNGCTDQSKDRESCPVNIVVHCESGATYDDSTAEQRATETDSSQCVDAPLDVCDCPVVASRNALTIDVGNDSTLPGKPPQRKTSAPDVFTTGHHQRDRTASNPIPRSLPSSPRRRDETRGSLPGVNFTNRHASCPMLPPPHEFGGGKPFLVFLCLSLMRQQKEHILTNELDQNDIAVHFDRLVRKHDVHRVLRDARALYAAYLKSHADSERTDDDGSSEDLV